jgi:hypothetical protein
VVRYLAILMFVAPVLWAASPTPPTQCLYPNGTNVADKASLDWDGSMSSAVRQEEYTYFNKIYQFQAQLKSAMLKYAMLQEQETPDFSQMQDTVKAINNLRLQMDLAELALEQQVRSMMPKEQYRQWRAQWTPTTGYEWSLLYNRDPNQLGQAMALWQFCQTMSQPSQPAPPKVPVQPKSPPVAPENLSDPLQQLPAQSMQRALQFSNS